MFRRIPRKLEEVLGEDGTDEFVDFINDSFSATKENTVELVSNRFENRLSEELNAFRSEHKTDLADLRAEFKSDLSSLRTELKEDIAELRSELKGDIAELRTELKGDIADLRIEIHKLISIQTRWMLGAIVALTGIFSIIVKL